MKVRSSTPPRRSGALWRTAARCCYAGYRSRSVAEDDEAGVRIGQRDLYIASSLHYGMQLGMIDKRPAFVAMAERATARPAFQRASEIEARESAKL
jgi:glutathione S-transferase